MAEVNNDTEYFDQLDGENQGGTLVSPICTFCVNYDPSDWPRRRRCKAFDLIPLEIWNGKNPHTAPYEGDHGLQFKDVAGEGAPVH